MFCAIEHSYSLFLGTVGFVCANICCDIVGISYIGEKNILHSVIDIYITS